MELIKSSVNPPDRFFIIDVENIDKLPSFESIRRRREEIQNDEKRLIPTDPEVLAKRQIYYLTCARDALESEGQPVGVLDAVCRRCPNEGTQDCLHPPEEREGMSAVRVKWKV